MDLTRREMLQAAALAALAGRFAWGDDAIRLGVIIPKDHPAASRFRAGVELGVEEAGRRAELVGRGVELREAVVDRAGQAPTAAQDLLSDGASVVFGGIAAAHCDALAAAVPESYLEVRARQELAPNETRIQHLAVNPGYQHHARTLVAGLHALGIKHYAVISPNPVLSEAARSAGLDEVQEPDAEVLFSGRGDASGDPLIANIVSRSAPGFAAPMAWHASLRRYGAAQLNERFKTKSGTGMDENAWYGWFSVKLISESALRGHDLAECRTDGHKGAALSFVGRRIKQPLYVIVTRPPQQRAEEVVNA